MSKRRKGLSLEEKRQRLLEIYHESKAVYNLKEIEKLGSSAGIGEYKALNSLMTKIRDRSSFCSTSDN